MRPDNADECKEPIVGGNNTSMAENYYLFFKPLPVGDHTIESEATRQVLQSTNLLNMTLQSGISRYLSEPIRYKTFNIKY